MALDSTSTTRIGLPPKSEDRPPGIDDGIRNRGVSGEWIRELDDRNFDSMPDMKDRGGLQGGGLTEPQVRNDTYAH